MVLCMAIAPHQLPFLNELKAVQMINRSAANAHLDKKELLQKAKTAHVIDNAQISDLQFLHGSSSCAFVGMYLTGDWNLRSSAPTLRACIFRR